MTPQQQISSDTIEAWPLEYLQRLRDKGITTAQQIVAIAAAPAGVQIISDELGASIEEVRSLVVATKTYLPNSVVEELEKPVDLSEFGRGVPGIPPDYDPSE